LDAKSYIAALNQQLDHHHQNGIDGDNDVDNDDDGKVISKTRKKSQYLLSPSNLAVAFESFLKVNQLIVAKNLYIDLTHQDDRERCDKITCSSGIWSMPVEHDLLLSPLGQIVS
jgi:hypothetical protein